MTEERCEIARRYIFDMINSFVEDPETENYPHLESTPPIVSFYSPEFEKLLQCICEKDSYAVKHPDLELLDFGHSNKYDIDGHCVHSLNGTIYISIDGVSFDQTDIDDFIRGYKKGLVEEEEEDKANKVNKVNKATVGSKESPSSFPRQVPCAIAKVKMESQFTLVLQFNHTNLQLCKVVCDRSIASTSHSDH